jgi:hypothetical protein
MAYIAGEARQELLDTLGDVIDDIAAVLAALAGAYEQLTTVPADRLEEQLFGPVQTAYGRAKRTHTGFAQRHGLPARAFSPAPQACHRPLSEDSSTTPSPPSAKPMPCSPNSKTR